MDLDKLFSDWKAGRLKYPELRRASEDAFFGEVVSLLNDIMASGTGSAVNTLRALRAEAAAKEKETAAKVKDEEAKVAADRMAKARAAKAAKREEQAGAANAS